MKKLFIIICMLVAIAFFLWPATPESRISGMRETVINDFASVAQRLNVASMSKEEVETHLYEKGVELESLQKAVRDITAWEEREKEAVGYCRITGQKNQFNIRDDPRPNLETRIEKLQEEIDNLKEKL